MNRDHRSNEAGSAYVLVLLSLVVLTTLGLVLASVTTTEMQIGQSERVTTRALYAAESGIHLAFARALNANTWSSQLFRFRQEQWGEDEATVNRGFQLDVSPVFPLRTPDSNYSTVNATGVGYGAEYKNASFAITSTSNELTWNGDEETPPDDAFTQSQKTISAILVGDPVQPDWTAVPLTQADLDKLKF